MRENEVRTERGMGEVFREERGGGSPPLSLDFGFWILKWEERAEIFWVFLGRARSLSNDGFWGFWGGVLV